jgi:hypothetical protein
MFLHMKLFLRCGFQGQGVGNKPHNCALLHGPKVGQNLPRPEKHDATMKNVYYGDGMPEHT